jgi:hypothetical protein
MTPTKHTNRRRALGAAVLLAAVVAACSTTPASQSSDPAPEDSTTTTGEPDLQAFSECMRDNGLPEFPDPGPDGLSLTGTGLDPESAEFQAAREACQDLMPQQSAGSGAASTAESDWQKVVPAGDCACADGSEFAFWERPADDTKVVLYLEGGGSCTDATTCAFTGSGGENDYYDYNLSTERPGLGGGIFDFDRDDNPFKDYSFVYVPLCTGDVYLGDATVEYAPGLTVQHKGYVNGTAALAYLAQHYPDATEVVVVGRRPGRSPLPSTAASPPTCSPAPRSPCSAPSPATCPTTPTSTRRSSATSGAPTGPCPTGRSTPASPPATGASPASGPRPASTTPTSCWPASTTPTTPMPCGRWSGWASSRRPWS